MKSSRLACWFFFVVFVIGDLKKYSDKIIDLHFCFSSLEFLSIVSSPPRFFIQVIQVTGMLEPTTRNFFFLLRFPLVPVSSYRISDIITDTWIGLFKKNYVILVQLELMVLAEREKYKGKSIE